MIPTLRTFAIALSLLGVVSLAACGSKVNETNYAKIANEMTPEQVTAILGEPTKKEGGGMDTGPISVSAQSYIWESGDKRITVQFLQNKVVNKTKSGF